MNEIIPVHQWTNGGTEVLLVKCVGKGGTSYGGFRWPLTVGATVEAPDWDPFDRCGGGLHGWPWGLSPGVGKEPTWDTPWLVLAAKPEDVVDITSNGCGKAKARKGTVVFVGDWQSASNYVLAGQIAWVVQASRGAASATGWSGAASATGESGAASATGASGAASATGARGAASATGESGAASATGASGAASATGERGAASATGTSGAASATGPVSSAAATGERGKAMAGEYGCIALAWWNKKENRAEMRCARTCGRNEAPDRPERGVLKPHVWYRLDEQGEFVEAE